MQNRFIYQTGFAPVPYAAMRDADISIGARGLLALMMTHSSEWVFNRNDMIKKCGCGKDKYDRMRKELIKAGYLEIKAAQTPEGKMQGYQWHIFPDKNNRNQDEPDSGLSDTAFRKTRNPVSSESGLPAGRKTRKLKDRQAKGKTKERIDNGKERADALDPKPDQSSESIQAIEWDKVDPIIGTIAFMDKKEKYALPSPFYAGKEIKDHATIDLKFTLREYQNIMIEFTEYWRDQAGTKKGKKTSRGWSACMNNWLSRKATDLKTQYREKPFDHREKKPVDDTVTVDPESLPLEYWRGVVTRFADQGDWSGVGPAPDQPGCKAPIEILQENGFKIDT